MATAKKRYVEMLLVCSRHCRFFSLRIFFLATQIRRMCWSLLLVSLCEVAEDDAAQSKKRAARAAEKKRDIEDDPMEGGVLAAPKDTESSEDAKVLVQKCFDKLWLANASWAASVIKDALQFARNSQPRSDEVLSRVLRHAAGVSAPMKQDEITTKFVQTVWPSLKNRGWKAQQVLEGANAGKTQYSFEGKQVGLGSVLKAL